MLHENLGINKEGHLTFGGIDTLRLAAEYGTPLIVMDEDRIRRNLNIYKDAMGRYFGKGCVPAYASKAFCCKAIYRILEDEKVCMDAVSAGELFTAKEAGFDISRAYFHGNNKTDADIRYAVDNGVGTFVCDGREELDAINAYCKEVGKKQNLILRLSPGIDPHTHKAVVTGSVDSKFGTAIETGQAAELTKYALSLSNINLLGFHCHIGSQIFDEEPFCEAADIMLKFIAYVKSEFGFEATVLNLGGGLGVRYIESQPQIDYAECIKLMSLHIKARAEEFGVAMPKVVLEPGRSIVADAGLSLYEVGSVKTITGYKSYVSVDGGMPDNPRYALYESPYTVWIANRMNEKADFTATIAGRCCESGDLLQENVVIPRPKRGDILAMPVSGAYQYAMASNYNRIGKPAVVMIAGGEDRLIVRKESFEDMAKNEL